jgi:hypothetical protein
MDTQRIRCPVRARGIACGREELLEKRKAVGARPGSRPAVVHHECGEHMFHVEGNSRLWHRCGCLQENE